MSNKSLLHRAALAFAASGIRVFPCVPDGKQPAIDGGFHAASDDPVEIDAWWSQADYNIGLSPEHAGWAVVDLDPPIGEQSWAKVLADLGDFEPITYTVRTPRGGRHLYFAGTCPTTASKIGEKIDTRGVGGYVLAPPSIVNGKRYEVISDAAVAELPSFVSERIASRLKGAKAADFELDTPTACDRARSLLSQCVRSHDVAIEGRGGDDRTYRLCAEVLSLGLSADKALELIEEHWNPYCEPPWETEELRTKILNASQYAQNDQGAWAVAPTSETFADALDQLPEAVKSGRRSRFYLEDTTEQENHPLPEWLIKDLLVQRSTALLVGTTGSFKTFLALNIAMAVATGREAFGCVPDAGPVVYAAAEGRFGLRKRRRSWELGHGFDNPASNFYLTAAPRIAFEGEAQEFGDQIVARLGKISPKLIVLDTVAKCMVGLNENDARDAGRFIQFCDSLVETFGCTVVAVHHKSDKANASDIRGTSAFRAGIDTYLEVIATKRTKAVELFARQHKDADEPERPWTFVGKPLGQSLYFQSTTADEHQNLVRSDDELDHRNVGAALRDLDAHGEENAVTTTVLAAQIIPPLENETTEARELAVQKCARRLGSLSKTRLAAYCSLASGRIAWHLPAKD